MKKKTFTRKEVENMLVSVLLFSSANKNQGLKSVKGENFGEQAKTIISAYENKGESILSIIEKFK